MGGNGVGDVHQQVHGGPCEEIAQEKYKNSVRSERSMPLLLMNSEFRVP
jgi:hypothetical protein